MSNVDMDKLLEQVSPGGEPRAVFREQVLRDSIVSFARGRRSRARWPAAALSVAAVVIAAVSFLLGRFSQPQIEVQTVAIVPPVVSGNRTAAVPSELVAWLEAARFFKQLGMEDRVARAHDRVSRLLPPTSFATWAVPEPMFAASGAATVGERKQAGPTATLGVPRSVAGVNRIMAQSFGDQEHVHEAE